MFNINSLVVWKFRNAYCGLTNPQCVFGRFSAWIFGRLSVWIFGRISARIIGRLSARVFGCLSGRVIWLIIRAGYLVDYLREYLVDYPRGYLVDHQMTHHWKQHWQTNRMVCSSDVSEQNLMKYSLVFGLAHGIWTSASSYWKKCSFVFFQ